MEKPKQEKYYSCKFPLGPCSRKDLATKSQKTLINFAINLQDLRFEFKVGHFKPYKNLRI